MLSLLHSSRRARGVLLSVLSVLVFSASLWALAALPVTPAAAAGEQEQWWKHQDPGTDGDWQPDDDVGTHDGSCDSDDGCSTSPLPPVPKLPAGTKDPQVPYGKMIASAARRNKVPVALMTALVWQESRFNARAKSPAGARGLTQLMPATAKWLGVRKPYDPAQNLSGGARYLAQQLRAFGKQSKALAAYNAGPGAVRRFGGIPPYAETRNYVRIITARARQYKAAGVR